MPNNKFFFENTFLFENISDIDRLLMTTDIEERTFQKGEIIYSPDDFGRKIGFVKLGECVVYRHCGSSVIPLNKVCKYDSFGILTCFSDREQFPTFVKTNTGCTVLFIYADSLRELMKKNHVISLNIVTFLAKKIDFLNDKIAAFSGGSIEEKLAGYLLSLMKKNNSTEFEFNKKKSAEALNCGRASLYRAIDSLRECGYISLDDKKIIINDPKGLERI